MKKASYVITVPKPCSENWEEMTPADKGRFCAACQKTVIDFTSLPDREVLEIMLKAANGSICGHYHASQLQRVYTVPPATYPFPKLLRKIAAGLLFFEAISANSWAQVAKPAKRIVAAPLTKKDKNATPAGITGHVTDYATGKPLPRIVVQISGTDIKDTTNAKGAFHLSLPDSLKHTTCTLTAHYENRADMLPGTMIADEEVRTDIVQHISLYRYPLENLNMEIIKAYREPIVNGGGGFYRNVLTSEEIPKPVKRRWWWPFHKKISQDE